jgi:hypothetical protein
LRECSSSPVVEIAEANQPRTVAGSQYTSLRFTERLELEQIQPSIE